MYRYKILAHLKDKDFHKIKIVRTSETVNHCSVCYSVICNVSVWLLCICMMHDIYIQMYIIFYIFFYYIFYNTNIYILQILYTFKLPYTFI